MRQTCERPESRLALPEAEQVLSARDRVLGRVIKALDARWPARPMEDEVWGLMRIVIAQQISTRVACRLAEGVRRAFPHLASPSPSHVPDLAVLCEMGLPKRRAECCVSIVRRSDEIRGRVQRGATWQEALAGIKGIGPWTIAVFRIMVLRHPDVLPLGDVGLNRAIADIYGPAGDVHHLGELWRPFRSVACWYLWRTLGNEQLG